MIQPEYTNIVSYLDFSSNRSKVPDAKIMNFFLKTSDFKEIAKIIEL